MMSRKAFSRLDWCCATRSLTRPDRLEFALVDDGHAVANGFHFAQLVRGKEHGFALVFQALDDFADFHAAQRIEAAGRFIENQQIGIVDERLREADALLHSFGIGFDGTFAGLLQFDQLEQLVNAFVRFRSRQAENARVKPEQFLGGEKFVVIGHFRQIADALAGDGLAHVNAEKIRRAAGGRHEAEQDIDGRGFARAVRPEKTENFADIHLQIETAQGDFGGLPELTAGEFNPQFFRFQNDAHTRLE